MFIPTAALLQSGEASLGAFTQVVDSEDGNDGNDGLSLATAKATIDAAYGDLPAVGGMIYLTRARHDVGSGFACLYSKPVFMKPLGEHRVNRYGSPAVMPTQEAMLYSSAGPLTQLVNINSAGVALGGGFRFQGIGFDITDGTTYGIQAKDINHTVIEDCFAVGPETPSAESYLVRAQYSAQDLSWWRFLNNTTRHVGLCDLGSHSAPANLNQIVMAYNVVLGPWGHGIRLGYAHRCVSAFNNLESCGKGGGAAYAFLYLDHCQNSMFIGDGGERTAGEAGSFVRAIGTTGNKNNIFAPLGVTANFSGQILVDDDNPGANVVWPDRIRQDPGSYSEADQVVSITSADSPYSVPVGTRLIKADATGGNVIVVLPKPDVDILSIYAVRRMDASANTVTVKYDNGAGGSVSIESGVTCAAAGTYGDIRRLISDGSSTGWWMT